jgi:hypothetical protein
MTMTAPATTESTALAQYSNRRGISESERTYTLYPDRLEIRGEGFPSQVHDLSQVKKIHLRYHRTQQRAYYQCFIHTPSRRVTLVHTHWAGLAKFEDRRETYTTFVRALLLAASKHPSVKIKAGSLGTFIAALVFTPVVALLAVAAAMVKSWWIALGLGFTALTCLSIIPRSRPRTVDPANPPANVLP